MNTLADACMACFPGDAPAAVPLAIGANADGTLAADYRCPLCGLAWRTSWTVTAWPAARAYRTTSQLLDEVIGLLAGLFDAEELEAA
jgi:hypothetical protein